MEKERDPLNLKGLPLVSPPQDDWPVIQAALPAYIQKVRCILDEWT